MRAAISTLRNRRITGYVALVVLQYFLAEWIVSATWRGQYGYRDDVVGPLGLAFCGPSGNWPCSALYPLMNVSFVLTGLAICFVALSWAVQRLATYAHTAFVAIAGLALAFSGVVTETTDYPLHSTAMTVFFVLGSLGILLIGLSLTSALSGQLRTVAVVAGFAATIGYFCFTGGHTGLLGPGWTERLVIYPILFAVVVIGCAGMRSGLPKSGVESEPTREPEPASDTEVAV